jgi:putative redox protein
MNEISVLLTFGNEFEGTLRAAHHEVPVGSGKDGALAPYDMMLGALGSCFYSTFTDIAKKMRLHYERAEVAIHGVKRAEVPTTLETVDMVFTVYDAADSRGFERATELAAKHCSEHETIAKVLAISLKLVLA